MTLWLLVFAIAASGAGCASTTSHHQEPGGNSTIDSSANTPVEAYKALAFQKYEDDVRFLFNPGRTAVLCVKQEKPSPKQPFPTLRFFVYDLERDAIVFEESLANGRVVWLDDTRFRVSAVPGVVRGDERVEGQPPGYVYDLHLKRKSSIASEKVDR